MNEERLAEIEARHQAAVVDRASDETSFTLEAGGDEYGTENEVRFYVEAVEHDVPDLIAEVRRLREENAELHERVAYEHSMYIYAASGQ